MTQDLYPLGDFNTYQIKEMVKLVQNPAVPAEDRTTPEELYMLRPDAAPNPAAFIRTIPPEEAPFIVPDAFAGSLGIALASRLTIPQLEAIGAGGDVFLMEAIKLNLKLAREKEPSNSDLADLLSFITQSPAWQY